MKIINDTLTVGKTARFCSNTPSGKIKNLWIVIHGYAQLASDFIGEFEFLNDDNTLIIAPEGLSKFYSQGKPAASWMTKEDRENEIKDYLLYLESLTDKLFSNFDLSSSVNSILGFSQGVHTAVRFFTYTNFRFNRLVLCSSDFPKDADFSRLSDKLHSSELYYIFGTEDKILSDKNFNESRNLLSTNKIIFTEINFPGGHEINPDAVKKVQFK